MVKFHTKDYKKNGLPTIINCSILGFGKSLHSTHNTQKHCLIQRTVTVTHTDSQMRWWQISKPVCLSV